MRKNSSQTESKKRNTRANKGRPVPAPFASIDALLEGARRMFQAREALAESSPFSSLVDLMDEGDLGGERVHLTRREERKLTRLWHESFEQTGDDIELCRRCREASLNRLEREILVLLLLDRVVLIDRNTSSCGAILRALNVTGHRVVKALRCMSEEGRLYRSRLISYDDEDEDLRDRSLVVDPLLVDSVIRGAKSGPAGWPVRSENELYRRLSGLTVALQKKADALNDILRGFGSPATFYKFSRKADRLLRGLLDTLALHPRWGLSRLLAQVELSASLRAPTILIALLGRELGHLRADDDLFQGGGLARAASDSVEEIELHLWALRPSQPLVREGYVQPCCGNDVLLTDDPKTLEETEFELTDKSLEILALERHVAKDWHDAPDVREACLRMNQLVLAEPVRQALEMATAQARHPRVLIENWGLGEVLPYGRAVTLLFSGPPGVGKTACAEAIAHALGRPILVADYARVQNCFVGNTEKNIVRLFRSARAHGAVLFWDEADAMFYSRDSAMHTWEVRDVNVLLQELEKFEGVCILATNRKVSLDPALERRITLKVEFERPDRAMRRKIWELLLPARLPRANDVDLDRLADADLCGGEIKNVVLNAARLALVRSSDGPVCMADFEKAIRMELAAGWTRERQGTIGFHRSENTSSKS